MSSTKLENTLTTFKSCEDENENAFFNNKKHCREEIFGDRASPVDLRLEAKMSAQFDGSSVQNVAGDETTNLKVKDVNVSIVYAIVQPNPKLQQQQQQQQQQFAYKSTCQNKTNSPPNKPNSLNNQTKTSANDRKMPFQTNDFDDLSIASSSLGELNRPSQDMIDSSTEANNSHRFNMSNVLKYIYTLKYGQKPTDNSTELTSASSGSLNTNSSSLNSSTAYLTSLPINNNNIINTSNAGNLALASSQSSKQFWMPDDQVKECYECNEKFTTFRRKHHCRVCGQIFCSKCSDHEVSSQIIWPNTSGNIRTCNFCHSLVSQIQKGDDFIQQNTSSIKELMRRLSVPDYNSDNSSLFLNTMQSLSSDSKSTNMPFLAKSSQNTSPNSSLTKKITNNNNSYNNNDISIPNLIGSSTSLSLLKSANAQLAINIQNITSSSSGPLVFSLSDDNNPFEVTENNRDYLLRPQQQDNTDLNQLIINNSFELRNLWIQLYHTSDGLQFTTRNVNKFKRISNCITSRELVEWLMKKKSVTKDQAIVIGQALLHGKWLECVYQSNSSTSGSTSSLSSLANYYTSSSSNLNPSFPNQSIFCDDNSLYKPGSSALNMQKDDQAYDSSKNKLQDETDEGPEWIKELNKLVLSNENEKQTAPSFAIESDFASSNPSVKSLNLNDSLSFSQLKQQQEIKDAEELVAKNQIEQENKKSQSKPALVEDTQPTTTSSNYSSSSSSSSTKTFQNARTLNEVNDDLIYIHKHLQIEILKQLLKLKNISFDWFDTIINLVWQSVHLVKPDVKHDNDSMDIRSYIKIKKLSALNLTRNDCKIINGLVFTKNVAHKQMQHDIKMPKVLLFRASIEYQRTEEKLCSLEPVLAAESQYLRNFCTKLLLKQSPEVLVVEKSVARLAQEHFLQSNISLVLNVKSSIMDKLCRFLQADPIYSIDDPIRKPKLGFCSRFHVETYQLSIDRTKSLMFFEGTPTNLGCTILLSGTCLSELKVIKSIMRFMIYVAYNSKLEHSFILDKYADFLLKNSIYEHKTDDADKENSFTTSLGDRRAAENFLLKENKDQNTLKNHQVPSLIKSEISIDESPLDEKLKFEIENHGSQNEDEPTNASTQTLTNLPDLKLTICEQHKEKSSISLTRNFKLLLDDLLLSISPFVKFKLPYLLSDSSQNDPLKKYLPQSYMTFLQSHILLMDSNTGSNHAVNDMKNNDKHRSESTTLATNPKPHDFLSIHLTKSFDDLEIRKLYADYKSRGGVGGTNAPAKRLLLKNIESSQHANENDNKQLFSNDCLDIFNRQNLAVLFYSQCDSSPVYPNICHKPKVIYMKFYSENDMTLGSFLAKNCFRTGHKCNNELCNTLIVNHTRSFVHGDSKVTVRMSIVPTGGSVVAASAIQHTANPTSTNNPHQNLNPSPVGSMTNMNKEDQNGSSQFSNLSVAALNSLNKTVTVSSSSSASLSSLKNPPLPSQSNSQKANIETLQKPQQQQQQPIYDDINIFMWSVCKVCNKSSKKVAMSPDTWSYSLAKFLELTFHAKAYQQFNTPDDNSAEECKHLLFEDHYQYFRFKNIVTVFSQSKIYLKTIFLPVENLKTNLWASGRLREDFLDEIKELYEKGLSLFSCLVERLSSLKAINLHEKQIQKLDQYIGQINADLTLKTKIEKINLLLTNSSSSLSQNNDLTLSSGEAIISTNDLSVKQKQNIDYDLIDMLLTDLRKFIANSVFYWNTKMSEFFKKSKHDDESSSTETLGTAPIEISKQTSSDLSSSLAANENQLSKSASGLNAIEQHQQPLFLQSIDDEQTVGKQQHSVTAMSIGKRLFANLIPSTAYQPLKIPFPDDEHYMLSTDSKYYVNDKYLTSIIAFTLSSREYREFQQNSSLIDLAKLNQQASISIHSNSHATTNQNNQKDANLLNSASQHDDDFDSTNIGSNGTNKHSSGVHFELQFHDTTTKFYCKAYYAELFRRLRKILLPNDEEKFIHSLFRCVNWEAKGGKSNSQFRKTFDNRFIIKEMSRQEVQSFLEFAPDYIQYISDSIQNRRPTALAKIVGAFRICYMKNTTISSKAVKIDVIVMENLFYSKKNTHVFDLKGSERNRLIAVNNLSNKEPEKDLVLLDENFLRWSFDNPLYVRSHTKYVLMKSIDNDSKFLSSKFVMDYSLLCGINQETNEISIGIIDYLRVFTWDKKVETVIKTIGGQGKMPTIVSPEVYKNRFINAIDRYFFEVPDQWYQEQMATE